jgi:hypothetical protein
VLGSNEDLDASGNAGLTPNQATAFERHDHLVGRGRTDLKVVLRVGLGGRAPEHMRIDVDESQVLALLRFRLCTARRLPNSTARR